MTSTQQNTSTLKYKALLVLATLIWGSSFVVIKDTLNTMSPAWLMSIRFFIAGAILSILFLKRMRARLDKKHIIHGTILGVVIFLAYWVQNIGLMDTTPGRNAFLTAMYCVMVPFLYWVVSQKAPRWYNIIAALLCIAGVGLMSLGKDFSLSLRFGDALTLVGAFGFAIQIVLISAFAQGKDMIVLTAVQFFASSISGLILSALFEPMPAFQQAFTLEFVVQLLYLAIFASSAAMLFQNIGQAHVPPAQASLLLSLEGVFGVIFSVIFYKEHLTLFVISGFILIFIGILLSEITPQLLKNKNSS